MQRISEAFLFPVRALIQAQFPFVEFGFHADNGPEFINHKVAGMLEKLRIEQTKSRARHSHDNAQAESKNERSAQAHGLFTYSATLCHVHQGVRSGELQPVAQSAASLPVGNQHGQPQGQGTQTT